MIYSPIRSPIGRAIKSVFDVAGSGGGPAPAFDPASLFGVSDRGGIYDLTSASNLKQLSGGTTDVAVGDPIGYVNDLGPVGRPALQAAAASRPVWAGAPRELGSEIVTNGRFATDTDWTKGTGWTINATTGRAEKSAGTASVISIPITVTPGKFYFLPFYITRTAGTITARLTGGTTVAGTARSYIGSYVEIFQAVTGNVTLEFSADAAFAGSLGNVSLKEVVTWADVGALLDGSNDFLRSAAIDMSGSQVATAVVSFTTGQTASTRTAVCFGRVAGNVAGSFDVRSQAQLVASLRGATGTATAQAPTADASQAVEYFRGVSSAVYDLAGATIADQVVERFRGESVVNTTGGALAGGGNLSASGAITLGAQGNGVWPHQGLLHRAFVINRRLTLEETQNVESWAKRGMIYAAVLGDSTSAMLNSSSALAQAMPTSALCAGLVCGAADLSLHGDRITHQKTKWQALANKGSLQAVIVQIGLNDVKGRVGENAATSAQVIADLQDLVDTINAEKPAGCKVYIAGLIPCKVWLDLASNPAAAYAAWQAVNEAIAGNGATPITGVDGRITSHVAALAGAGDILDPKYDMDGVHENNEARFIIAQAWRARLEADGLL